MAGNAPIGIRCLQYCCDRRNRIKRNTKEIWYRIFILVFTFLCYTSFHLSRKPLSVVKNVLNANCSGIPIPPGQIITNETKNTWCHWAPFNSSDSETLLGTLDSAFLFSYAFSMFISGFVAERVNLRYYLSFGMILSGVFTYLFGIAYNYNIHQLWYFIVIQAIGGIVQSSGWPSVVTCIGNWFGKGRRGLIFGIWNSHTSVGNILGSVIAGVYVDYNWGLSFIVPGIIIGVMGFLVFLFLVPYPEDVGLSPPDQDDAVGYDFNHISHTRTFRKSCSTNSKVNEEERPILVDENGIHHHNSPTVQQIQYRSQEDIKAVTFTRALKIPGVIEFALCLFFAKLVSYTFLYWLPRYINKSTSMSATDAAYMSTLFDLGGIVGGIIAGVVSDHTGASAATCSVMLFVAIPMLFVYQAFGKLHLVLNIILLMICGLLVNGPYALITTAVSAELGTHKSLRGNSKALATVASIIDGTGSFGAAVGPLLAGVIAASSFANMFYMLMAADILAMLLLFRLAKKDVSRLIRQWKTKRHYQFA
ncbi:hypothetical protein CHUAL_001934 [Chamberlinius hualienensis]